MRRSRFTRVRIRNSEKYGISSTSKMKFFSAIQFDLDLA